MKLYQVEEQTDISAEYADGTTSGITHKNSTDQSDTMAVNKFSVQTPLKVALQSHDINVTESKPLGKGHFGEVWKGSMYNNKNVAVKVLMSTNIQIKKEMEKEVAILRYFSSSQLLE